MSKRNENETLQDYRTRLAAEKVGLKLRLKGRLLWDSRKYGTYVKARDGVLA